MRQKSLHTYGAAFGLPRNCPQEWSRKDPVVMIVQPGLTRPQRDARQTRTNQNQSGTDPLGIGYSRDDLRVAAAEVAQRLTPYGRDAELATSMFSKLSLQSVTAQTIFGVKPLSEFYLQSREHSPAQGPESWITTAEFEAWQRVAVAARLVSSNFIIRESDLPLPGGMGKVLLTYNTHNVRDVFARHGARFKAKLDEATTADSVIERLHTARDFNNLFDGDHELKGIIIGYGQMSSAAYGRLCALCEEGSLGPPTRTDSMKERIAHAALPEGFPKEEFMALVEALDIGEHSPQLPNAVSFRPHREDHESHDLLQRYNSTAQALLDLATELGEDVVGRIALARWCGLLP
jgi:hypothetical protein